MTGCYAELDYVIPGKLTGGIAWKPSPSWTVVADVGWIDYSSVVTENLRIVPFHDPSEGFSASLYSVNDVVELHGGVEYLVFGDTVSPVCSSSATLARTQSECTVPSQWGNFVRTGAGHV